MMIINFLKDLVKTTMRKVLITATLMIIDVMLFLLTSTAKITNNEDLHVTKSSSETLHSENSQ